MDGLEFARIEEDEQLELERDFSMVSSMRMRKRCSLRWSIFIRVCTLSLIFDALLWMD